MAKYGKTKQASKHTRDFQNFQIQRDCNVQIDTKMDRNLSNLTQKWTFYRRNYKKTVKIIKSKQNIKNKQNTH